MPKLWSETIDAHRREVRDAIIETTVALIEEHGLLSVTMSRIAEESGIGRATLYKYFPDVEAILRTWHERQISEHLKQLEEARDSMQDPMGRLSAVLNTYALIAHGTRGHRDTELGALLHGHHDSHAHAERELRRIVHDLIREAAAEGLIRNDVDPTEITNYSLHALSGANSVSSKVAVRRLVEFTLAGLRPAEVAIGQSDRRENTGTRNKAGGEA